jgi:hypothetical protein
MNFVLSLPARKKRIFERLDRVSVTTGFKIVDGKRVIVKKSLFGQVLPFWQWFAYIAIVIYFIATLIFQENPFPYTTGAIKPFIVLIQEIVRPTGTHLNPLLNRGLDAGGHILAYLSLMGCVMVARIKLPKTAEGFYFSLLIPAFALSVSEGSFNIFYWTMYFHLYPHATWLVFILTNPLAAFYIFTVLISVFVTPVFPFMSRKRLIISIVAIYAYFFVWAGFGLPVTLSSVNYLAGGALETIWYGVLSINAVEIGQWLLASVAFSSATKSIVLRSREKALGINA